LQNKKDCYDDNKFDDDDDNNNDSLNNSDDDFLNSDYNDRRYNKLIL
jgi:hypothetical protein